MAELDSNVAYPHEKRGGLDRYKERLSVAVESKARLEKRLVEVEEDIRVLSAKVFELEDGRLLRAIKNILAKGESEDIQSLVDRELEVLDLAAVIQPGKKSKVVQPVKAKGAGRVGRPPRQKDDEVPPNPDAISMPKAKSGA